MSIEHLVTMANDIASYFASEPDHDQAVAGVRDHIRKFWDPRMRRDLVALVEAGGKGLDPVALAAARELAAS